MPDAVVGPAQVGVRDLDAVPEVELDAGLQRVPLRTGGETRSPSLPLRVISVAEVRSRRRQSARTGRPATSVTNTLLLNVSGWRQKLS